MGTLFAPQSPRTAVAWIALVVALLSTEATAAPGAPAATGATPSVEDVAEKAAAAFENFDVAPRDGVLAGPEAETVAAYDRDADGRVTPEEFVRGFMEKPPLAPWQRHEFKRQGFACEMPGVPQPLDAAGGARFQVAVEVPAHSALLIARLRDMPVRAAGKPDRFFDTVVEQLEASGARILDRKAADLGLHRGSIVAASREDGTVEVVRSVVVGRSVYEMHAIVAADIDEPAEEMVKRFTSSLQLVR